MNELQFWLRVFGTSAQVLGLMMAFIAITRTHRRYSPDHSGLLQAAISKASARAKIRAQMTWNTIRGRRAAQGILYSASLIGSTRSTLTDPPANTRSLDTSAEASEQFAALATYAAEDFDSIRSLEAARDLLTEEMKDTRDWLREVQQSIEEMSTAQVREHALDGLSWAAVGLLITAVGTVISAFS
jgi:hypothetical protein